MVITGHHTERGKGGAPQKRKSSNSSRNYCSFWWRRVDSLFCGKATPVAARHWRTAKSRLSNPQMQKRQSLAGLPFCWWRRVDSNHRSESQQIYSLPPLATRELLHVNLSAPRKSQPRPEGVSRRRRVSRGNWFPLEGASFAKRKIFRRKSKRPGAGGRTRTPDRLITNQLLYQLSYTSVLLVHSEGYFNREEVECQGLFLFF